MTRPTTDDLIHAASLLEQLAYRFDSRNNPNAFREVVTLLDLLLWVDTEAEHAKHAAAYGPATDLAHTIGRHGLTRPTEDRFHWGDSTRPHLRDPLYRDLRKLQRAWVSHLNQLLHAKGGWREQADEAANWPERTKDTGT